MKSDTPRFDPRLRLDNGNNKVFGPGKAELLKLIAETGSIRTAAKAMSMSYNRAWTLIRDTNDFFTKPLVQGNRGGKAGGGASLTKTGEAVLKAYLRMDKQCRQVISKDSKKISSLVK
jgi:molybdate transport system regulatory protein